MPIHADDCFFLGMGDSGASKEAVDVVGMDRSVGRSVGNIRRSKRRRGAGRKKETVA